MPLGFGLSLNPRRSGASSPANSATDWYFAQFGLAGTPWADVSRTGLGTRVDSAGLVGFGPHNLLLQSGNIAASEWVKGGSTIGADSKIVEAATNDWHGVYQVLQTSGLCTFYARAKAAGRQYAVFLTNNNGATDRYAWFDLVARTAHNVNGGFTVSMDDAGDGYVDIKIQSVAAGTNAYYFFGATDAIGVLGYLGNGSDGILFPRGALVNGQFADYVPTTTAARYLPRITHDPATLSALGLLVEGQGTNVLAQPANPSVSPWTGSASAVQAADYQGLPTWTLTKTTTSSFEERRSGAFTAVVSTYTYLVIAYAGTSTQLDFLVYNDGAGNRGTGHVLTVLSGPGSVAVGALFHQLTGLSSTVPTVVQVTFTSSAGLSRLSLCPGGASSTTIGHSVRVQLRNIETGSVATSYIPNPGTGSAVRVADDWFLSGAALDAALGASRTGFTMTMRFVKPATTTGLFQRVVGLCNGDNSRRFELLFIGNRLYGYSINGGAADEAFVSTDLSAGEVNVSFSISGATVNISVAGQSVVTLSQCPSGANITRLFLLGNNGTSQLNSTVAAARTLPGQYITGAALQALTA